MKRIGFIGAYDKTDLLLCISKMLTLMYKKVLIIDSTANQKARYLVPSINPSKYYITSYEDIDIAVGLKSLEEVADYINTSTEELKYDFVLADIDNVNELEAFGIENIDLGYFVTAFDLFSLKKGVEIISGIRVPTQLKKILFSNNMEKSDDEYLNYLSLGLKVRWAEDRIYFPENNGDRERLAENDKVAKISIKDLSKEFKQALIYIVTEISDELEENVRKIVRQMEKDTSGGAKWR